MDSGRHSTSPFISSLPVTTRSKLRSSQILTSIPQLVSELVQNSLDAGARNIDVSICLEDWECWVRDDGHGISRDGFAVLGGNSSPDGMRYRTSKSHAHIPSNENNTFGFRGEALASVADLCCLEISSRTKHSQGSRSLILKGGKSLYSGPSTRWRRETPGTVVLVRDAFYNLPIRRLSHPSVARTLELVKRDIESYALVFPHVSFSVDSTTKTSAISDPRAKTRILTACRTSSTLAMFRQFYGRALAEHVEEIHERVGDMELDGFLSLHGASSKSYQFMYINKHPVDISDLQRCIDVLISRSTFGKHAYDESGVASTPRSASRRSPRKTDKQAVYVLNLTIPPKWVDNSMEPTKTHIQLQNASSATTFLSSVVESVLIRRGFLAPRTQCPKATTPTSRKKRKLFEEDSPTQPLSQHVTHNATALTSHPIREEFSLTSESLPTIPEDDPPVVGGSQDDSDILWKDPATGEVFVVDARTGNSYPQNTPSSGNHPSATTSFHSRRSLTIHDNAEAAQPTPSWLAEALQANEVYHLVEPRIPALPPSLDLAERHGNACAHGGLQTRTRHAHTPWPAASQLPWDAARTEQLTPDDLRRARVLGQVDRKFVACVVGAGSGMGGGALVLVDQHAADERVRVERFLRDLCDGFLSHPAPAAPMGSGEDDETTAAAGEGKEGGGVRMRRLEPVAHVLLTRPEAERVSGSAAVRAAFARWGVVCEPPHAVPGTQPGVDAAGGVDEGEGAAYVQVAVTAVPEVVADKLVAGDELRDLVRGYLATLEEEDPESVLRAGRAGNGTGETGDMAGWQRALRWCPRGLVELANSKACRGAIMFNDTLSREQCAGLLLRLSATALPFQCAHGRPSLVPLVDTRGADPAEVVGCLRPPVDWVRFGRMAETLASDESRKG